MTVLELVNALTNHPMDAEVYVDLCEVDCFAVEDVDTEDDDGEVTVYLKITV